MARIDPGPVIVDGKLRYTSVSQLEKAKQCPAKWGFEYVLKRKPPKSKAMELGDAIHQQQEHYLTTGEDVRGPIARAAARYTPAPKTVHVELPLHSLRPDGTLCSSVSAAGVPIVGYMDVLNPGPTYIDSEGDVRPLGDDTVEVVDWKSTSSFEYVVPGPKLIETIQMPGYGMGALAIARGRTKVRLSHVPILTKGQPAAMKSTALATEHEIRHRWSTVEPIAELLKSAAGADPDDLPKNLSACRAYGGCPHITYCNRASTFAGDPMSLTQFLPASLQPQNAPAPAPAAPTLSPDAARMKAAMDTIRSYNRGMPSIGGDAARVWAEVLGQPPAPGYAGSGTEIHQVQVMTVDIAEQLVAGLAGAWGPPPAAAAPAPFVLTPPVAAPAAAPAVQTPPLLAPETPASNPAAAFAPAEAPAKRGPGRPKGSGKKGVSTAPTAEGTATVEIYVDCVPSGTSSSPLNGTIDELAAEFAAECKVPDIRCSEHPAHGFGKWKGALAAVLRAALADGKIEPGAYYLDSRSDFGAVAAEALGAAVVARGVR